MDKSGWDKSDSVVDRFNAFVTWADEMSGMSNVFLLSKLYFE